MRTTILFGLLMLLPVEAAASTYYKAQICGTTPGCEPVIVGYTKYIAQGSYTTASTANLTKAVSNQTATPDTVMHVTGPDRSEIVWNDDCPGQYRSSCVSFTAPASGIYRFWVHSYSNSSVGKTDLIVDGVLVRSQAKFAGAHHYLTTTGGEVAYSVPNNKFPLPNGAVRNTDTLLFMLRGNQSIAAWDDDSGPNLHGRLPVTEPLDHFLVAYYPDSASSGSIGLLVEDSRLPDSDFDGLSDELESKLGSDPSRADTDGDGIPDYLEVIGNDGFNYAELARVTGPDVFVEIDVMTAPDPFYQRSPPPNLGYDLFHQNPFGPFSPTRIHVFVDQQLPVSAWARYLCNGPCNGLPESANFWDLRENYFVAQNPERVPYFKYGIWGYQLADGWTGTPNCASGLAEYPGANFMITLGCVPISEYTDARARGTFLHELGHLLNLDHNGNDNSAANSVVHQSQMNYRYMWQPVPPDNVNWTAPAFRYSLGTMGTDSCLSSPKKACVECRQANACGSWPCNGCDTDVNEASIVQYDHGSQGGWWSYGLDATWHQPSPNTTKDRSRWAGPRWNDDPYRMQLLTRMNATAKQLSGLRKGVHFKVAEDETRLFSVCNE